MWDKLLDYMLGRFVRTGTLILHMPDGTVLHHGDGSPPEVAVRLHDEGLPRRLVSNVELVVGEAYMDGTLTIDDDDLHALIELALRNMVSGHGAPWQRTLVAARNWLRIAAQFNPIHRARRNVAHHYDLSGDLYDLFLDADRQYSCAYFRNPDDTLEAAQAHKKAHIATKLMLEPDMRVLDIGCGWGGMALTLARDHGVKVLGITLSQEQLSRARERAHEAGLEDRVEFRLTDYRSLLGQFDRIVSVGMFEHVGVPHYRTYFRKLRTLLSDDGVALIHTIGRNMPPGSANPWLNKYIFPGGYTPAMSEVLKAIEKENLWATDIEIWRLHYARTLHHWQQRFEANIDEVRALYDERFCRMWRFYLVGCEQAFRFGRQCVYQFQLAKQIDAVPLTRDYIYAAPTSQMSQAAAE
ncbi:SAM-dependent methyltransferase [Alkalilacustris brevis]|uniref:SAM-dependent methyltransferase n=1 Tax=Alkalilacustris brevis TaxID=2026338 RepID=UPI000E0DA4C5|nr:cyclopropane-fatty-acyl-phospholipid synthase family protein [Alkalilacustris brevis]